MDDRSGPEPLGDILTRLFTARGWGRKQERLHLEKAWAKAAGPEFAALTRVLAVRKGMLEVEVHGSVLLQELTQFHKRRILGELKKTLPEVKDVRFKSGAW